MRIIAELSNDCHVFTDVNEMEDAETVYLDITDLETVKVM